jgi:cytochrome c nitrite reductase small subunit
MRTLILVFLGAALGLGLFTFSYADGASYFSNDAAACANCHVMQLQYDAWLKGSHARVAACNDCHAPHDNLAAKLAVKGLNGMKHSWAFTTGLFPEPIRATAMNRDVAEASCLYCHGELTHAIQSVSSGDPGCIRCHPGVGHRTRK